MIDSIFGRTPPPSLSFPRLRGREGWGAVAISPLAALLAVAIFVMSPHSAAAEPQQNTEADALSPVEEYARQVDQFTKNAPDLSTKIEEGTKSIDGLTDVAKAREEIERIRAVIGDLLAQVADNGVVAQLGAKARSHARQKLQALERETRFKPEERQFLVDQWRELLRQTEVAADDLENARSEFAGLLRTLQTREDFIDELMQLRRAAEAIKVIRQLTGEIRDASQKIKSLIGGIKPPGV
jgi:DNA repair exonuclease SbcCD ATPase subunit